MSSSRDDVSLVKARWLHDQLTATQVNTYTQTTQYTSPPRAVGARRRFSQATLNVEGRLPLLYFKSATRCYSRSFRCTLFQQQRTDDNSTKKFEAI